MMPYGDALLVWGLNAFTLIDTKTNQKIKFDGDENLRIGGRFMGGAFSPMSLEVSPDGTKFIAFAKNNIVVIDLLSMEMVGKLKDIIKDPSVILFEETRIE